MVGVFSKFSTTSMSRTTILEYNILKFNTDIQEIATFGRECYFHATILVIHAQFLKCRQFCSSFDMCSVCWKHKRICSNRISAETNGKHRGKKKCARKHWCLEREIAWMFHIIAPEINDIYPWTPEVYPMNLESCQDVATVSPPSVLWPGKAAIKTFWWSRTLSIHISFSWFFLTHGTNLIFQRGRCGNSSAPRSRCRDDIGRKTGWWWNDPILFGVLAAKNISSEVLAVFKIKIYLSTSKDIV